MKKKQNQESNPRPAVEKGKHLAQLSTKEIHAPSRKKTPANSDNEQMAYAESK
jgi:hypothetical protein